MGFYTLKEISENKELQAEFEKEYNTKWKDELPWDYSYE